MGQGTVVCPKAIFPVLGHASPTFEERVAARRHFRLARAIRRRRRENVATLAAPYALGTVDACLRIAQGAR